MADSPRNDLSWVDDPDPTSLRRAVRHALRDWQPGLRIVAEAFRAAETRIDLLGVAEHGELVSLRIATANDAARSLTVLLSDLAWLDARATDLQKLAPDLDLVPGATSLGILLASEFDAETRLALGALPKGRIQCLRYQSFRRRGQLCAQLWPEPAAAQHAATGIGSPTAVSSAHRGDRVRPDATPQPAHAAHRAGREPMLPTPTALAPTTGFRTGLSDLDLRFEPEEVKEPADALGSTPTSHHS